jgi:hypothetical protein
MPLTTDIRLFQIAYDARTLESVQRSGFLLLDNLANERPDWYEYWPIRKFLLQNVLDEDAFYGFFSPKFTAKTQLTHGEVCNFIADAHARSPIDVALFCPQPDMGANFLNVFEQAEVFDPGFVNAATSFLAAQGIRVPLANLVMDSRQIVYSNYFVARAAFWRPWFALTEALFAVAEDATHPLHAEMNFNTNYAANANRKVFLSERLASLLLYVQPQFRVAVANPFGFGWSMAKFRQTPEDTYINDALKRAFRDTGFPQYMDAFRKMRDKLTQ